jgi:transmembrane sensor
MTRESEIRKHALAWLAWVDAEHDCAERQNRFEAWLCADARHREAYSRLERSWRRADGLSQLIRPDGTLDHETLVEYGLESAGSAAWRKLWQWPQWIVAAVATGLIAVGFWATLARPPWQDYSSALGSVRKVLLADGTTVTLNTDSEIQASISRTHRDVKLIRGEALFAVAHDPQRPFEVEAKTTRVKTLGTAFSVRLNTDHEVDVLMREGRVELDSQPLPRQILNAGDDVIVRASAVEKRKLDQKDVARRFAWTDGHVIFDGETLAEAVAEMNRYNHWQLQIADRAIEKMRIGGEFRATDPERFVKTLEYAFGVDASYWPTSQSATGVIMLRKKKDSTR